MLLSVRDLRAGYGHALVLHGVDLDVDSGEIVSVLGSNGAGKTTTLRAISGVLPVHGGTVSFAGRSWRSEPPEVRARAGLGHVPEGRGILGSLTVEENMGLARALRTDGSAAFASDLSDMFELFPPLRARPKIRASALSGGQQQMLALARALLGRPQLLIIDELSFGLAPIVVSDLFTKVRDLRERGTTFLLVEQNASVLKLSDRTYVLAAGRVTLEAPSGEIDGSERLVRSYLGGGDAAQVPPSPSAPRRGEAARP